MDKIITSSDIEDSLRTRFCPPEYAFIPQVRNGTGYGRDVRTADALAMGLWPSRGLHLNGFEIKVGRGDWLSELKKPAKAEEIAQYCDFWWIVAPKDIVKLEELPALWGLMVLHGNTIRIIKQAPQLPSPIAIDRLFLAAILRKAQETICPDAKIKKAFADGEKKGLEQKQYDRKWLQDKYDNLQKAVFEFEKKSGVVINQWNSEKIGEAVRMVLNGEHLKAKDDLENLLQRSKLITKYIEETLSKKE